MIKVMTNEKEGAFIAAFILDETVANAAGSVRSDWCVKAYNNLVLRKTREAYEEFRYAYEINVKTIFYINMMVHQITGVWLLDKNYNPEKKPIPVVLKELKAGELEEIVEQYRMLNWRITDRANIDEYNRYAIMQDEKEAV